MSGMFYNSIAFSQNTSDWHILNIDSIHDVFDMATSFNQSLGNWVVSNVTSITVVFLNGTLSILNCDGNLTLWNTLNLEPVIIFNEGNRTYCNGEK